MHHDAQKAQQILSRIAFSLGQPRFKNPHKDPKALKSSLRAKEQGHTIAALYVQKDGSYYDLEDVDPWDEKRDARQYAGPHPVVAHPPCKRWGNYWFGSPSSPKRYKLGDDGGCFKAALEAVRTWGGVLEHPANSRAWEKFGLNKPKPGEGWIPADDQGGWTAYVEQGHYGHRARKGTWLYAKHVERPELHWGASVARIGQPPPDATPEERRRIKRRGAVALMGAKERAATPEEFRNILIEIARSAHRRHKNPSVGELRQLLYEDPASAIHSWLREQGDGITKDYLLAHLGMSERELQNRVSQFSLSQCLQDVDFSASCGHENTMATYYPRVFLFWYADCIDRIITGYERGYVGGETELSYQNITISMLAHTMREIATGKSDTAGRLHRRIEAVAETRILANQHAHWASRLYYEEDGAEEDLRPIDYTNAGDAMVEALNYRELCDVALAVCRGLRGNEHHPAAWPPIWARFHRGEISGQMELAISHTVAMGEDEIEQALSGFGDVLTPEDLQHLHRKASERGARWMAYRLGQLFELRAVHGTPDQWPTLHKQGFDFFDPTSFV